MEQMIVIQGLPLIEMVMMIDNLIDKGFVQISSKKTSKNTWSIKAGKPPCYTPTVGLKE